MAGNNSNNGADYDRALKEDLKNNVMELNKTISLMVRKKGANLLIRVAAPDGKYFSEFLGTILRDDGGYTHAGNMDWALVQRWVVAMIHDQVDDDEGFTEEELEPTDVYALPPDGRRKVVDDVDFKSMVAGWEMGTVELRAQADGLEYFEFENTRLLKQKGVLPSVEEVREEDKVAGGGGGRRRAADVARLKRASEASSQPETDRELRETPISTEDAHNRTQVLRLVSSQDENRRLDDWEYWQRVCTFFDCNDDFFGKGPKQLPGLLRRVDNYQLAAVFWLLTRYAEDGIAGPILGDDPGLGKTMIIIVTIKVHNDVQEAWADVRRWWRTRKEGRSDKHLLLDAPAKQGAACPSQKHVKAKYGIQCPCVPGSASMKIAKNMQDWPSVIVGLSGQGIVTWVSEWNETIDPASHLQLYVNDLNWKDNLLLSDFIQAVEQAPMPEGTQTLPAADAPFAKSSAGFEGGSRHVLLTSNFQCGKLIGAEKEDKSGFVKQVKGSGKRSSRVPVPVTGCAILALDEMHRYKGSRTQPLQLLLDIFGKHQDKPTLGVAVSGSLGSLGPKAWEYMLEHTRAHARDKELLGRLKDEKSHQQVVDDWKELQKHIQDKNAEQQNPFIESLGRLRDDWKTVMGKMFLRRGQRDEFRNGRIVDIQEPVHETWPLDMPKSNAKRLMRDNFRDVRMLMAQYGEKHKMELALAQRKVVEVNLSKSGGTADNRKAFDNTIWSSTFPGLPSLAAADDKIVPFLKAETDQKRLAREFSEATLDPNTPADARFVTICTKSQYNNPFWADERVKGLRDGSPKMTRLIGLIDDELIGSKFDKRLAEDQLDKGPEDDSYVRHMLVFARSPIAAYLTALVLHRSRGRQVDVCLFHAGLETESKAKGKPWHSRKTFQAAFDADCGRASRNKVAVLTYDLGATGWNLQRASVAVLLEVPARPEDRDQACNRVTRRGQVCRRQIFEMYYRDHLGEDQQKRINDGINEVAEIDWKDYGVTDDGTEHEEEGENGEKNDGNENGSHEGDSQGTSASSDVQFLGENSLVE
ncbi:hypothetical protein PG991_001117 [Apiospora marii]|uniref:Helicase C-terminal domain-containing protein n=1 Tax=Apiospora marii TaxID=335849 RepID=A0ABR1STV5_9PEZI